MMKSWLLNHARTMSMMMVNYVFRLHNLGVLFTVYIGINGQTVDVREILSPFCTSTTDLIQDFVAVYGDQNKVCLRRRVSKKKSNVRKRNNYYIPHSNTPHCYYYGTCHFDI